MLWWWLFVVHLSPNVTNAEKIWRKDHFDAMLSVNIFFMKIDIEDKKQDNVDWEHSLANKGGQLGGIVSASLF